MKPQPMGILTETHLAWKGGSRAVQDREIADQTAFEIAGIPTPPDHQDAAATDPISGAVAQIMDNIQHAFDPKETEGK